MATTQTPKQESTSTTDGFICPECGKTFTRAAALGAHRKLKHGVAGTSKNATGSATTATASRKRKTTTRTSRRATTLTSANSGAPSVNRDALLRTLFPNGIPPRQDVITQVNAWLEEAERLARSR